MERLIYSAHNFHSIKIETMNNNKSTYANKPRSSSQTVPSRPVRSANSTPTSNANTSARPSSYSMKYSLESPTSSPGSCSIKRNQTQPTSSPGSCSIKRSKNSSSTPSKRHANITKLARGVTPSSGMRATSKASASPSSTMTASTTSPGSSISSPGTVHSTQSNHSRVNKTSASISNMTLKSPPDLKPTRNIINHDAILKSLKGADGQLNLTKLNLTDKYQLWVFVSNKRKGSTKQEKQAFLNAFDHNDCLKDLYSLYTPSDLKMLYWQTCKNADVDLNPKSANWGRETLGKAMSKIVSDNWEKLSGER